mmetsp:Transcript_19082/g.45195  ORF Transcript_19082/g.45195 Transcript_19082/m.45195 type:complete len:207 (-) Transcript_19082:119-739(-)
MSPYPITPSVFPLISSTSYLSQSLAFLFLSSRGRSLAKYEHAIIVYSASVLEKHPLALVTVTLFWAVMLDKLSDVIKSTPALRAWTQSTDGNASRRSGSGPRALGWLTNTTLGCASFNASKSKSSSAVPTARTDDPSGSLSPPRYSGSLSLSSGSDRHTILASLMTLPEYPSPCLDVSRFQYASAPGGSMVDPPASVVLGAAWRWR